MYRKRLFIRVAACYMLLLCIILAVLSIALNYTLAAYKDDVVSATRQRYEAVVNKIDDEIQSFSVVANDIYTDTSLKLSIFNKYNVNSMEAHKSLSLYRDSVDLAEDMLLCFQTDKLYTSQGYVRTIVYTSITRNLTPESEALFVRALEERADDVCLPVTTRDGKTGMFYFFSSPVSKKINAVTVAVYVSGEKLEDRIAESLGIYDCVAMMEYEDGEILACVTNVDSMSREEVDAFCESMQKDFSNSEYTMIKCTSEHQEYLLYFAVSDRQIWERPMQIQIVLLCGGLIIFGVMMTAILLISYRFYRPVSEIAELAMKQEGIENPGIDSEYDIIRRAVVQNLSQSYQYVNNYVTMRAKVRETLTMFLCSGVVRDEERLCKIMSEFDLMPRGTCYAVMGMLVDNNSQVIYELLGQREQLQLCAVSEIKGHSIIFVIAGFTDVDLKYKCRMQLGNDLRRYAEECGSRCDLLASGLVYDNLKDICLSYREMVSVMEYTIGGKAIDQISFFDEFAKLNSEDYVITSRRIAGLYKAVREGDLQSAVKKIHSLMKVYENIKEEEKRRFHRYSIVQTIMGALPDDVSKQEMQDEFLHLYLIDNDTFEERVNHLLSELFREKGTKDIEDAADKRTKLLSYINAHYAECDLTQERVADAFGISRQSVNAIVKSVLGVTYSEYVSFLRCEYAAKLLGQTDLKVLEIVEKIGYIDASSFIRKFQTYYDMTPGQYRLKSKEVQKQTDKV